eukprot:4582979-Alexandrium_andersonii.AAC.1
MSASLVGSEMCIRDRLQVACSCLKLLDALEVLEALEAPTTLKARRTPVSYTHLTLPTICSV